MRPAVVAGLVLALLPAAAAAQSGPYLAVVSDTEVKLRAGPSDRFPETGTLPRGARVVVERDADNGWLEVTAPAGSVSWITMQFVSGYDDKRPLPQNLVVASDGEVTLAAGRADRAQPLDIRKAKVPDGTILTVIGTPTLFDGKTWYPVAPPHGDVRFLPKSAVQPERAVNTSFVVRGNDTVVPAGSTGSLTPPTAAIAGPGAAPKPLVNHPLWTQAEALEKDGKLDDAEKVYFQLARAMNEPGGDHDVANLCYTRIHALREKKRLAAPAASGGSNWTASNRGSTGTLLPPVKDDRSAARPPTTSADRTPPPSADRTPPVPPPAADNRPGWSGPGTLIRSALVLDGRQMYALSDSPQGQARVYVVADKGVDLERHVNRKVDVFGTTYSRRGLSKPYIVVTEVQPNP